MTKNYFSSKELECPCCHKCTIDEEFLNKLNKAREIANIPFVITSGYRCERHNKEVGGVQKSEHVLGMGVDIRVKNGNQRFLVITSALNVGFNRIGVAKSFVHIGFSKELPQNVIWTY